MFSIVCIGTGASGPEGVRLYEGDFNLSKAALVAILNTQVETFASPLKSDRLLLIFSNTIWATSSASLSPTRRVR
jgi:hypothetical protein